MGTHTPKFKIRLGLFITVGLGLFMVAIFLIGRQKNLFNPVFKLTTVFHNVSGLLVGSNVRFSGINVGTVDNIAIGDGSDVRVDMLIRENVRQFIRADCEAGIGSSGIIGDRVLSITQGSIGAPVVEDGQKIGSKEPIETDAIMASMKVTVDQVSEITTKINTGNGTLSKLIHDQAMALSVDQAISNLRKGSKGLSDITAKINTGNGTLSKLVNDQTMARNVDQTVANLRKGSKGFSDNMEAAKDSFLLRGSYKRKAKAAQKAAQKSKNEQKAAQNVESTPITTPPPSVPIL